MTKAPSLPTRDPLILWIGSFLMILGAAMAVTAALRSLSDWQRYNSPFDQLAGPAQSNTGFLPILYAPDAEPLTYLPPPQCSGACTPSVLNQDTDHLLPPPQCFGSCSGTWENGEIDPYLLLPPFPGVPPANQAKPKGTPELIPDRISIPAISLNAPILPVQPKYIDYEGHTYQQWTAPDSYAAGWHNNSALLGAPGNTVINGHHNVWGDVFGYLDTLKSGDWIYVYAGEQEFTYVVGATMILPERYEPLETRLENARWILPSDDERITLVTCWPDDSNTHRVIVVAVPLIDPDRDNSGL